MQQSLGGVMQQPSVSFGGLASSSQPQGSIFAGMQGMPGLQSLVGNLDQSALVLARPAPVKRFAQDPGAADAAIELQSTSLALSQQLQAMDTLARWLVLFNLWWKSRLRFSGSLRSGRLWSRSLILSLKLSRTSP